MTFFESSSRSSLLVEDDLFPKGRHPLFGIMLELGGVGAVAGEKEMGEHRKRYLLAVALNLALAAASWSARAQSCIRDPEESFVICDEGKNIAGRFRNDECAQVVTTLSAALSDCECYLNSNEARGSGGNRARAARSVLAGYLRNKSCQVQ
jgi:hypothetical protein